MPPSFRRRSAALSFAGLIAILSSTAASADADGIERHMAQLLNATDRSAVSVIQTKRNAYRMQVDSRLLLDAFHMQTLGAINPPQSVFNLVRDPNGSWSFDANQSFAAKYWEKIDGEGLSNEIEVGHSAIIGHVDPVGESRISVSLLDGKLTTDNHGKKSRQNWANREFELIDRPEARSLSTNQLTERLDNFRLEEDVSLTERLVMAIRSLETSTRLNGVHSAPLKTILAMGDPLTIPLDQNDAAFPDNTVIGATRIDMAFRADGLALRSHGDHASWSVWVKSWAGRLKAEAPDEKAENRITTTIDGMTFATNAAWRELASLFPSTLSFTGSVAGIDGRLIYLLQNPAARLGADNTLNYFSYQLSPNNRLKITDMDLQVAARDYSVEATGSMDLDLLQQNRSEASLTFRSKDLDRLIAAFGPAGSLSRETSSLLFLFYFLKGAGQETDDGALQWALVVRNGKAEVNGTPFPLFRKPL
ncbi:DUF2125 domain-containing protein [Rhizobium sp. FKL33]|uniref:DUF2125 domain-containing protein n=1 Tax=Rhizobium sp. FKL33 TaxID=2562307 RepID=UPI0010C0BAD3|nr:DUF2125 domain-containing protein [Rhizobium sp. FKL33]